MTTTSKRVFAIVQEKDAIYFIRPRFEKRFLSLKHTLEKIDLAEIIISNGVVIKSRMGHNTNSRHEIDKFFKTYRG